MGLDFDMPGISGDPHWMDGYPNVYFVYILINYTKHQSDNIEGEINYSAVLKYMPAILSHIRAIYLRVQKTV